MKKSRKILLVSVLAVGLAGGVTAIAHQGAHYWHHKDGHGEWLVNRIGDRLDLDAEQSEKLSALFTELRSAKQELRAGMESEREQLLNLLTAPVLNQQQVIDFISGKARQIEARAPVVVTKLAAFSDSLDNEQKMQLQELLERRLLHRHDHGDDGTAEQ